jgi:hypothetical protein
MRLISPETRNPLDSVITRYGFYLGEQLLLTSTQPDEDPSRRFAIEAGITILAVFGSQKPESPLINPEWQSYIPQFTGYVATVGVLSPAGIIAQEIESQGGPNPATSWLRRVSSSVNPAGTYDTRTFIDGMLAGSITIGGVVLSMPSENDN